MIHRNWLLIPLLLILAACAPATAAPTPTPGLTPTPAPTATPAPTPTATPIPQLHVTIAWPSAVSALAPIPLAAAVMPPANVTDPIHVRAVVLDPEGQIRRIADLYPLGNYQYAAEQPLLLALEPLAGDWRVIVTAASAQGARGRAEVVFQPMQLDARDLGDGLPAGVTLHIPRALFEVETHGDAWAGARVWRYNEGEISLWWAPGPIQVLQPDTAEIMLIATHPSDQRPTVTASMATTWQGRPAYLFREQWGGATGSSWRGSSATTTDSHAGEAWVMQAPNYQLFVLRIRGLQGDIPPVLRALADTFSLVP